MDNKTVVVERLLNAPVEKVWDALTIAEEIRNWYFDLPEFKAEVGFTFTFSGGPSPEEQYLHICVIKTVVPLKQLVYSWRYDGLQGDSLVNWELFPQEDKTLLRITHTGLDTFPNLPGFAASNFNEGWTYFASKALPGYVE